MSYVRTPTKDRYIDKKRDNQGKRDFRRGADKKAPCGYCRRKGKYKIQEDCPAWGERCGKYGKKNHFAKVCGQKATTKLRQLEYSEESYSNESTYIILGKVANVKTKKK